MVVGIDSRRGSGIRSQIFRVRVLEAVERIKFATQLTPEWVIVEYDKLMRVLESQGASVNEAMEQLASGDFDFDVTDEDSTAADSAEVSQ